MRKVKPNVQEYRKKRILQAAITHYIKTNKPVSSSIICNKYSISLSSATIRTLVSNLIEEGYLKHVHTSSGCVPTDKGYRYFVDSLIELHDLASIERKRIIEEFQIHMSELDHLFVHASHLLSAVSNYIGFVVEPKIGKNILRNIQLVKISETELLILVITKSGLVRHHRVNVGVPMDENFLSSFNQLLNEKFKEIPITEFGVRLPDIIDEIVQAGGRIYRVESRSRGLEEVFIDLIYDDGTGSDEIYY